MESRYTVAAFFVDLSMTAKRNQHYIPQFYLRAFSVGNLGKSIGHYNYYSNSFRDNVAIKSQASAPFFYGEDGKLEDWFADVETHCAPVFQLIIRENSIDVLKKEQKELLLFFMLIMSLRTKDAVNDLQETTNDTMQRMLNYDTRFSNDLNNTTFEFNNPAYILMEIANLNFPFIKDLEIKLVINPSTDFEFVCSDNPTVKYNQYLENKNHPGGHYGYFTKGLQIFMPISNKHLLVFFDPWTYKIGDKRKSTIVCDDKDIDLLNTLQLINCFEYVYFNERIKVDYLKKLKSSATKFRLETSSNVYEENITNRSDNVGIQIFEKNIEMNLSLSFILQTKKAKQHNLSNYVVQLRNENLRGTDMTKGSFVKIDY